LLIALLHKDIHDGLFSNIMLKWIGLHLEPIVQAIGPPTIKAWSVEEAYQFGLIQPPNGMLRPSVNTDEIKPIQIQRFNAV